MTFNPPGFRTFMLLALGFGLRTVSKALERAGDFADDPGTRLFNHVSALVVLIAAVACFIWALKRMFFDKPRAPDQKAAPAAAPKHVDIYPEELSFDPDAALARYMQNRKTGDLGDPPAPKPPGSFGRKGL
ncbi:hypothetical protein SAMN05428974_1998 [Sphingopyxis sp. YR583]|uniref:hypothetical protein n=1 Tax=Sphingopyxis sp. YR583 TaxID=1881047 RepID=UPI0008A7EAD5|nr:hypothetical protein [Sphingopyxis sp. YR583]SEH16958.1 hypothetical protein SAMN05428974_1998 [Sphingopyxis sp. YR583]